jgi:hypothetical protein
MAVRNLAGREKSFFKEYFILKLNDRGYGNQAHEFK